MTLSSAPFTLQDVPADGCISLRILAQEIGFGDAYILSGPEGDVEACNMVSVSLVAAFNAFEVDVASPVFSADMPAPWAGLAGVVGLGFFNRHTFSFSYALQGVPEECVGYAVNPLSALLVPSAFTFACELTFGKCDEEALKVLGLLPSFRPRRALVGPLRQACESAVDDL